MKLNKSSSYALIHLLNGHKTASSIAEHTDAPDIRSIQRALQRIIDLGLVEKHGAANSPKYSPNFSQIIQADIPPKLFDYETRPVSNYRFSLVDWLFNQTPEQIDNLFIKSIARSTQDKAEITPKDLEYLTVELSWKSSALEGNTYTLLDTQLLLTEGIRAKNRTEFETQMILNHKDAISFIVENRELFTEHIEFKALEELHKIIGNNLGIDSGVRNKVVRISASNYRPISGQQQLREQSDKILSVISRSKTPYTRALLALSLIPYLQIFEDGNKRTGRLFANALLISSIGRGFSLRKVDARKRALASLTFYEFSSMHSLDAILANELE